MVNRVYNFNPGPSTLPLPVLEELGRSVVDYQGLGMSVVEISHRSKEFTEIMEETDALLRELMGIPEGYHVIFTGGGASLQFAMLPMNLLGPDRSVDFIVTGTWTKKAVTEAKRFGEVHIAGTTEENGGFLRIPKAEELTFDPKASYVHLTSNNTIFCTQWKTFPDTGDVPLVADMSSDILSRPLDVSKFAYIFGGAQKNLGPAGVNIGIISQDLVDRCNDDIPTMLNFRTYVDKNSLFNTPPVFAIYAVMLNLRWVKEQGGVQAMEERAERRGELLYGAIDAQPDFFRGPVERESRSLMNAAFRLPTEELEKRFIAEGGESGLIGLKGHRSVGGVRVSMYNAMPVEGVERLVDFMQTFAKRHG